MDWNFNEYVASPEDEPENAIQLDALIYDGRFMQDYVLDRLSVKQLYIFLSNPEIDLFQRDDQGFNILHTGACDHNISLSKLKVILSIKPQLAHECDSDGLTPLHLALSERCDSHVIQLLLDHSDIYQVADDGNTVLHFAAEGKCDNSVFKMLLSAGADVNKVNEDKVSALHLAISHKNSVEVIKTLLQYGADPGMKDTIKRTALHYAAKYQASRDVFEVLLQSGFSAEHCKNICGNTPLMDAIQKRCDPSVVRLLLQHSEETGASCVKMRILFKLLFKYASARNRTCWFTSFDAKSLQIFKELMRAPVLSRIVFTSEVNKSILMFRLEAHQPDAVHLMMLKYAVLQKSTIKPKILSESKELKKFYKIIHSRDLSWMRRQQLSPELSLLDMVKEIFANPDWSDHNKQRWYKINPDTFVTVLREYRKYPHFADELKQIIQHLLTDRISYTRLMSKEGKEVVLNRESCASVYKHLSASDCCAVIQAAEPKIEKFLNGIY